MKLKEGNISELSREDRAAAKLARIARGDTVFGGARAMVIASRLDRIGSNVPAQEIVGDVYALSNSTCGERWGCYKCPECGQSYLGQEAALNCCANNSEEN